VAEAEVPDPLAVLEGYNDLADTLDSLKTALEAKGWSAMSAEAASIQLMVPLLLQAHAIQAITGGQ
jgi:hypothetical protein